MDMSTIGNIYSLKCVPDIHRENLKIYSIHKSKSKNYKHISGKVAFPSVNVFVFYKQIKTLK